MNNRLKYIFRSILNNGKSSFFKLITLSIGIAIALVLLTKVFYVRSYDSFYPNKERIYRVEPIYTLLRQDDTEKKHYEKISGGVVVGMANEISGVEAGTRFMHLTVDGFLKTEKDKELKATALLGDENFFDVLYRPIIQGDPKEILSAPNQVMISKSLASKLGESDIVGQKFTFDFSPGVELTISGIYQDFPHNSFLECDIIVSLPTIGQYRYDGSQDWVGNDGYTGLVKLYPNVKPEQLAKEVEEMQERHQDMAFLHNSGIDIKYRFNLLQNVYAKSKPVEQAVILLSAVAFLLLFISILNYSLLSTSTIISKSREIALHKCYGAEKKDVLKMVYLETFILLVCASLLAIILIVLSQDLVFRLTDMPLDAFLNSDTILCLIGILVFVFLITGIVPAYINLKIPVLTVLRKYSSNKRKSKLVFLFLQIFAASVLIVFLLQINRQYDAMLHEDVGYDYSSLLYTTYTMPDNSTRKVVLDEVKKLSVVEDVATAYALPFDFPSGNNVRMPNSDIELFNIADLYRVSSNYIELMGIDMLQGQNFDEDTGENEVLVSDDFVTNLAQQVDLSDGVIGKEVYISEHSICQIRGVYKRIRLNTATNPDSRASILFMNKMPQRYLMIKMNSVSPESKSLVDDTIQKIVGNEKMKTVRYAETMESLYDDAKRLQTIVLIGSIVAFIIVFIGIVGYTQFEVKSRGKEIAVRKINGANLVDLIKLFGSSLIMLSIPAIVLGSLTSFFLIQYWTENFAIKARLSLVEYVGVGLFILLLVSLITLLQLRSIALLNPVKSLKSE